MKTEAAAGRWEADQAWIAFIDVQERLLPAIPESYHASLMKAWRVSLQVAADLRMPVLWTEQYPRGLGATVASLREQLTDQGAKYFVKTSFSALREESFVASLPDVSARSVVLLLGLEAHICVLQTGLDLLSRGYQVEVAVDGVGSRRSLHWRTGLDTLKDAGARLTSVESFAFQALKDAQHPAFKAISALIR